ncbi:hypothetical protein [Kamptonema formosum]|nr:hypothetical protein [Oscillatoria sp. PCC 10802]
MLASKAPAQRRAAAAKQQRARSEELQLSLSGMAVPVRSAAPGGTGEI